MLKLIIKLYLKSKGLKALNIECIDKMTGEIVTVEL